MKIVFTEESGTVHERARYMRGGILKNYHQVKVFRKVPEIIDADIWFHGLSHVPQILFPEAIKEKMLRFKGKIAFFQNDDYMDFAFEKIPAVLRDRAVHFLRNVWPSDINTIHSEIRERIGLFNPLLKPNKVSPGKVLKFRKYPISFFGTPTCNQSASRIDALRKIKKANLPFTGGLFGSTNPDVPSAPHDLLTESLSKKSYDSLLQETQISIVLHGFNPLTFRFFESFAKRCLVIAQDLSGIWFAGGGLEAGKHFIQVKSDLSDLVEKIEYYLHNKEEAQVIADAGFELFKKNVAFSGVDLTQPVYEEIVASWEKMDLLKGKGTIMGVVLRNALPYIKSL